MLRFAADENLNNDLVRALQRRRPDIDIVRVQDVGLTGAPDPEILAWAAVEDRPVVTHDITTMTRYAIERRRSGQRMPGLVVISEASPIAHAVDDLLLIAEASQDGEWEGQVLFLPL